MQQFDEPVAAPLDVVAGTMADRTPSGPDDPADAESRRLLGAFARIDRPSVREVVLRMVERIATG